MKNVRKGIQYLEIDTPEVYEVFAEFFPKGTEYVKEEYLKVGAADMESREAAGVLVLSSDECGYVIEYIFVAEEYRKRGIGTFFVDLAQYLTMVGSDEAGRLIALSCAFDTSMEELFRLFYERPDMDVHFVGDVYKITPEDLKNSPVMKRFVKKRKYDTSFNASGRDMKDMYHRYIMQVDADIRLEDLEGLSGDLSQIVLLDHEVMGFLLARVAEDGDIVFEYIYTDPKHTIAVGVMLSNACYKAQKLHPNANVHIEIINEKIDIKKFFPGKIPHDYLCVTEWNYLPALSPEMFE